MQLFNQFKVNTKPIKEKTKTLLQQSAFLKDTAITDNDDFFEKKIPRNDEIFCLNSCLLTIHPSTKSILTLKKKFYNCKLIMEYFHL